MFRVFFRNSQFTQISQGLARGSLVTGLLLIGFGMLVFVLRDLFAFLAAAIFFMAGFSAIGYAIRTWIMLMKQRKQPDIYRDNVNIHYDDKI